MQGSTQRGGSREFRGRIAREREIGRTDLGHYRTAGRIVAGRASAALGLVQNTRISIGSMCEIAEQPARRTARIVKIQAGGDRVAQAEQNGAPARSALVEPQ